MCVFAIRISSLVKCLSRLLSIFIGLFVFLFLSFKDSLCVLETSPISNVYLFAKTFSQYVADYLFFLSSVCWSFKFWWSVSYQLVLLCIAFPLLEIRNHCLTQGHKYLSSVFFLDVLCILGFTIKSIIQFELILIYVMKHKLKFFFFPIRIYNWSSTICRKDCLFSTELPLQLFQSQLSIYVWVYFWIMLFSIPLFYMSTNTTVLIIISL